MKNIKIYLVFSVILMFRSAHSQNLSSDRASMQMIDAAQQFLAAFNDEQKEKIIQKFEDEARKDWEFYPRPRKGLALKAMTTQQRILAHALLKTGLSSYGYLKANTIMGMEPVLKQSEDDANIRWNLIRDQENYFIAIWGNPSDKGNWGWRIEGHHVSVHLTMSEGKLIANTPLGFGSSPAEIRFGPRAGFRTFPFEEDLGRELITSMSKSQQAVTILDSLKTPGDMMTMGKAKVDPINPVGIAYSSLDKTQQELLFSLITEYLGRMPLEIAAYRLNKIQKGELNNLYFSWYGGLKKGDEHYYRIQGKSFVIEYDNSQTKANHIHSAWCDFEGDFGYNWLAEHIKTEHSGSNPHNH
jgi:hypothetical protein